MSRIGLPGHPVRHRELQISTPAHTKTPRQMCSFGGSRGERTLLRVEARRRKVWVVGKLVVDRLRALIGSVRARVGGNGYIHSHFESGDFRRKRERSRRRGRRRPRPRAKARARPRRSRGSKRRFTVGLIGSVSEALPSSLFSLDSRSTLLLFAASAMFLIPAAAFTTPQVVQCAPIGKGQSEPGQCSKDYRSLRSCQPRAACGPASRTPPGT